MRGLLGSLPDLFPCRRAHGRWWMGVCAISWRGRCARAGVWRRPRPYWDPSSATRSSPSSSSRCVLLPSPLALVANNRSNTTTPSPIRLGWLVSARSQVWRVDLDGPGKFEAYRRKYLLLFSELLRDTRDVDRLELLVLKLFKDPIISQQRDVLVASCSSLVQVHLPPSLSSGPSPR